MKKTILIALGILLLTSAFSTPEAQQQKKIAILPFSVNSSENISYIRDGIWDMLISRVTVGGKTDVLSKSSVLETMDKNQKKDLSQGDASAIGKRLKADFVVWGSITKIGDSLSLDGKLLDVATNQSPVTLFEQTRGMNEVIPKINDFSQRIRSHVTGEALAAPSAPARPRPRHRLRPWRQPAQQREQEEPRRRQANPRRRNSSRACGREKRPTRGSSTRISLQLLSPPARRASG